MGNAYGVKFYNTRLTRNSFAVLAPTCIATYKSVNDSNARHFKSSY
jgi:hypothetical protein